MYNMLDFSIGSVKIKGEYILIVIIFWIMFGHVLCGCSRVSPMEGFEMIKDSLSDSAPYQLNNYKVPNTKHWLQPNLTTKKGSQEILNRPKQPIPLPENELDMFATTEFKPECCPNAFSMSTGCACMTVDQYKYLVDRGGNNVPYSEY
jgi:hypothetical protein